MEIDKKRFKSSNGQFLTKALFVEYNPYSPVYTLQDDEYKGCPSLYRLYLSEEDQTEYRFANNHLFSWEHWKKLLQSPQVRPSIDRWREELYLLLLERKLKIIQEIAEGTGRDAFQAQKYLIERPWEKKISRGKPQKEPMLPEISEVKIINEDYERIQGLVN